ncbi:MAG: polysaccharide pyruvyl transferase family protein [Lachnospiraceae bacterium]|nr:polysaccharide pyruvyl transferase family protein [Lachnospiraceae bacterium]
MNIGILTYHRSINYGAFVQCFALRELVANLFPTDNVEVIDYDSIKARKYYQKYYLRAKSIKDIKYIKTQRRAFFNALDKLHLSDTSLVSDDPSEFGHYINRKYDLIIVGSDEIWNVNGLRGFPNPYWLPQISGCMKMAFAVSARNEFNSLLDSQKELMGEYLKDFSFISLRDGVSYETIQKIVENVPIYRMCDPTMAFDFNFKIKEGKKLLEDKFGVDPSRPVIGVMDEVGKLSKYISDTYKKEFQIISIYKNVKGVHNAADLTPFEWIQVIGALDGLVTSFFHGMCLAINANVQFRVYEYRNIDDPLQSKSFDLLSQYGYEDRYYQMNKGVDFRSDIDTFLKSIIQGKKNEDFSIIKNGEKEKFKIFQETIIRIKNGD